MTMQIDNRLAPEAVLQELGRRIARRRVDLGVTQAEAAEQGGLGKRTVERIEAGEDSQVSTFIRLLRVLDLMDGLNRMVPEPGPRPLDLLRLKGKERKRASRKRTPAKRAPKSKSGWRWGDER